MPQALAVAQKGNLSPPPPCCEHDRSMGVRARVTIHALRRCGDRILGMEEALDGLEDVEAVDAMQAVSVPIEHLPSQAQIRKLLAWSRFIGEDPNVACIE